MTPLRYSDITPELHAGLRIIAALEVCYPQHGDRATRTLAGFEAWKAKQRGSGQRTPQAGSTGPGIQQKQELSSSRDLSHSTGGVLP